ncbi:MAG: hypothetical protein ACXVNQ_11675 [Bacteroidia bacterium]
MKGIKFIITGIMLVIVVGQQGCYYDKQDKLHPRLVCDTTGTISYTSNVKTILDNNCTNSCHGGSSPLGGINLDTYAAAKNAAVSGKLYSSIVWDGTTSKMPQGGNKLDECSIMTIKKWIDTNYPQ